MGVGMPQMHMTLGQMGCSSDGYERCEKME